MLSAIRNAIFRPTSAMASRFGASSSLSIRSFAEDSKPASSAGAAGAREAGTVKWFDAAKGFGFIVRESGTDVFVHFSGIRGTGYRTLEEGQKVEFTVQQGVKGNTATDVSVKH